MASVSPKQKERGNSIVSANASMSSVEKVAAAFVKQPYAILTFVVILVSFFCAGMHKFELEKNLEKLWIEDGSDVQSEMAYKDEHYYEHLNSETQLATTIVKNDPEDNSMTPYILDKHFKVQQEVKDITVDYGGKTYDYEDVCSAVQPHLLQCTRVTAIDCFKEGAFDFTAYNAIYALSAVLTQSGIGLANNVLQVSGEIGVIDGTEDAFIQGSEAGMISQFETQLVDGAESQLKLGSEKGVMKSIFEYFYMVGNHDLDYDASYPNLISDNGQIYDDGNMLHWNDQILDYVGNVINDEGDFLWNSSLIPGLGSNYASHLRETSMVLVLNTESAGKFSVNGDLAYDGNDGSVELDEYVY